MNTLLVEGAHSYTGLLPRVSHCADPVCGCECITENWFHKQSTLDTYAVSAGRAHATAHVTAAAGVPVDVSTYNCVMAACRVPPTRVVPVSVCTLVVAICFGCDWLSEAVLHWQCQQAPMA